MTIKIKNAHAFSSHPGHGSASKTIALIAKDVAADRTKAEGTRAEEALDRRVGS